MPILLLEFRWHRSMGSSQWIRLHWRISWGKVALRQPPFGLWEVSRMALLFQFLPHQLLRSPLLHQVSWHLNLQKWWLHRRLPLGLRRQLLEGSAGFVWRMRVVEKRGTLWSMILGHYRRAVCSWVTKRWFRRWMDQGRHAMSNMFPCQRPRISAVMIWGFFQLILMHKGSVAESSHRPCPWWWTVCHWVVACNWKGLPVGLMFWNLWGIKAWRQLPSMNSGWDQLTFLKGIAVPMSMNACLESLKALWLLTSWTSWPYRGLSWFAGGCRSFGRLTGCLRPVLTIQLLITIWVGNIVEGPMVLTVTSLKTLLGRCETMPQWWKRPGRWRRKPSCAARTQRKGEAATRNESCFGPCSGSRCGG